MHALKKLQNCSQYNLSRLTDAGLGAIVADGVTPAARRSACRLHCGWSHLQVVEALKANPDSCELLLVAALGTFPIGCPSCSHLQKPLAEMLLRAPSDLSSQGGEGGASMSAHVADICQSLLLKPSSKFAGQCCCLRHCAERPLAKRSKWVTWTCVSSMQKLTCTISSPA